MLVGTDSPSFGVSTWTDLTDYVKAGAVRQLNVEQNQVGLLQFDLGYGFEYRASLANDID